MASLTMLEVDAKVGHMRFSPELRPDERFVGAKNFLTCTKVRSDRNGLFSFKLAVSWTYMLTGLLPTINVFDKW